MLEKQLHIYNECHRNMFTKILHLIGVPLIIFSISIIFNWLELTVHGLGSAPFTWLMIVFLTLYYCFFDWRLALICGAWMLALALIAFFWLGIIPSMQGFYIFIICFVIGWLLLLLSHLFERRKPAFTDNFWQVLSAPLFITLETASWFGFKKDASEAPRQ